MIFEYVYRLGKRYTELMNKFNEQTFYTYNLHFFLYFWDWWCMALTSALEEQG